MKILAKHWLKIAVVTITLILAVIAFFNVIIPADTFHWDESHHALYGVWITKDIQSGDWSKFWEDTHHQTLWPFFHSWYIALFLLIFGISYVTARAANLFGLVLLLLAIWLTGRELDEGARDRVGVLAWGLAVTAPLFWIRATENMMEPLGALLTVLIFYCVLKLYKTNKWLWIAPLGLFLGLIIVTKYNYALFVFASLALWALYELFEIFYKREIVSDTEVKKKGNNKTPAPRTQFLRNNILNYLLKYFYIVLFPILVFLWWMLGENSERKWQMIAYSKSEYVEKAWQVPGFINNFLYYFKQIIAYYTWFPLVGWLIIIGMIGVVFICFRKKDTKAILLSIFTWVSMFIAIFIFMNKLERYMYSFAPILLLAAAYFWVNLWGILRGKIGEKMMKWISVLVLIIMAISILSSGGQMINYFRGKGANMWLPQRVNGIGLMDVLDYFKQKVPANAPVACGIALEHLSPYVFYFHFSDREAPFYNLYSLSQVSFSKGLYLITLRIKEDSPYFKQINENSVQKWNDVIDKNKNYLSLFDSKDFPTLGIRAEIYLIK